MEYLPKEELSKVLSYKIDKIYCDFVGSITSIPVENKTFSATASCHVIEHTSDPLKAIREQIRVTKESGYVLIIIPNFRANKFDFQREPLDINYFKEQHEDPEKIIKNTQKQINEYLKIHRRRPEKAESIRSGETRPHYYTYCAKLLEDLIIEACKLEQRTASMVASFYHDYNNEILALLKLDTDESLENIKSSINGTEKKALAREKLIEISKVK